MIKVGIECESIEDSQTWGVGRIINKLLEEISKRPELGNEFKFFLYFKSKIPDYQYLRNSIFIKKIIRIPILPPSFSFYYYVLLPIKLYFEKLDVMYFPNYMLPIIFKGKSLVTLTEDIYYEFSHGNLPFRYKLAYRVFGQWAARRATVLTAMSESSKKNLVNLFKVNPERITVNQLGVDIQKPADQTVNFKNYILYVGQAFPRRHLRETILAFEKISKKFPDLNFVAIGKDKYNPPIISNLINKVNQRLDRQAVIHQDYISPDELMSLYLNAKCLIYVSSEEAFGLPPLEALAYGTAPIVSRSDIAEEIFGKAPEENAFFVDNPDSIDSIASAITSALTDDVKRKRVTASAGKILAKYAWADHTDRFLKIIKDTLHD